MSQPLKIWTVTKPITNRRITPDTKPPLASRPAQVDVWGAPNQHLPASVVLWTSRTVDGVRLDAGDLRHGRDRIAADQIDLRIVKCWYMAGIGVWAESKGGRKLKFDASLDNVDRGPVRGNALWLAPELLVKDDYLIDVDRKRQTNILRFTGMPTDAKDLQPFKLNAREAKQIWITVHVPEGTAPGRYEGRLRIRIPQHDAIAVPLACDVLAITLSRPALDYMLYYDAQLTARWGFTTTPHHRTARQMLAELKDMRAHGVDNTIVNEWISGDRPDGKNFDFCRIDQAMDLRERAGFPIRRQPLFWSGGPNMLTGHYKHEAWVLDKKKLAGIERTTKAVLRWAKRRGISEVYVAGIDEVQGNRLKQEIRAINLIHRLGAKLFVAVRPNFHDYIGDLIDCPILNGDPGEFPKGVIERIHRAGGRCYNYGHPQGGECRPHTYRRNYGLYLLKTGMDGPCPYAYMCMSGRYEAYDRIHPSHGPWLQHLMAYPTEDGVIPTWGWEGWRAAVDDVRYVTTLKNLLAAHEGTAKARTRAQRFLESLNPNGNLDAQRRRTANLILDLKSKLT